MLCSMYKRFYSLFILTLPSFTLAAPSIIHPVKPIWWNGRCSVQVNQKQLDDVRANTKSITTEKIPIYIKSDMRHYENSDDKIINKKRKFDDIVVIATNQKKVRRDYGLPVQFNAIVTETSSNVLWIFAEKGDLKTIHRTWPGLFLWSLWTDTDYGIWMPEWDDWLYRLYYDETSNNVTVYEVKEIVQNLFQHVNHRYTCGDMMCYNVTPKTLFWLQTFRNILKRF